MQDSDISAISDWLAEIGLPQFVTVFIENGIDIELLPELTSTDLIEIGVSRLADRKRIIKEIAQLSAQKAQNTIERRIISVFFCDMVGSTARSTEVDPEEMRYELKLYQDTVVNAVNKHGGFVSSFAGDGVMAYFGWPHADEDQASHAVRAALDSLYQVNHLKFSDGYSPRCRVGIATGRVVVGGQQDVNSAFGETPNLAARLQTMAKADQIVIDSVTYRSIGEGFDTEFLQSTKLKGFDQPVEAWAVQAERAHIERFEASSRGRSEFVGRDREMQLLGQAWAQAESGIGGALLLRGGPGIGKSRIVRQFCEHSIAQGTELIRYQCSTRHLNSSFFPVIKYFEKAAGIDPRQDTEQEKLNKVKLLLEPVFTEDEQALALFAKLFSIEHQDAHDISDLTPQQRRAKTIELLVKYVFHKSVAGPLIFIVEDAHWIDPSSQQLLEAVMAQISSAPVLLLITSRISDRLQFAKSLDHTEVLLPDLTSDSIEKLVRDIDQANVLSPMEINTIVERAEGVPLFAEEITQAAIELDSRGQDIAIPESIEASIAARLDHLGNAKNTIQVASVIGREFQLRQLGPLAKEPEPELLSAIGSAIASGLNQELPGLGDRVFRFMHALIQDVAYNGLLKTQRRELHQQFAELLRNDAIGQRAPELIAYHLTKAGETAAAIEYWMQAGGQATAESATTEAISHYQQGLELISKLSEDDARNELEFSLWVGMAMPLIVESGYTSDDLKTCISKAVALSDSVNSPDIYQLLYSQWGFQLTFGLMQSSEETANEFCKLAERQNNEAALYARYRMLGATHMCQGRLAQANEELSTLIEQYDPAKHAQLRSVYGIDLRVAGLCFISEVLWLQGSVEQAKNNVAQALDLARELNHLQSHAISLHFSALVAFLNRDRQAVIEFTDEMFDLERRQAVGTWPTAARAMQAWAKIDDDTFAQNLADFEQGTETMTQTGIAMFVSFYYCRIAEELLRNSQLDRANEYLVRAHDLIELTGETVFKGEMLQLSAQYQQLTGKPKVAEQHFQEGLICAREQGALSVELRIATSYARYLLEREKESPLEALSQIVSQFPPDLNSEDLRTARDLLAESV